MVAWPENRLLNGLESCFMREMANVWPVYGFFLFGFSAIIQPSEEEEVCAGFACAKTKGRDLG